MPGSFGLGIMIPLLKNPNADVTKYDNYRGITLSPRISKIFEQVLVCKYLDYLYTSDLQFGFKCNIGCPDALFTLQTAVDYFTANGCTVTLAALDISKAFDKISHYGLYLKLMERGVPRGQTSIFSETRAGML